jgi:GT2 family glycosyltransferase
MSVPRLSVAVATAERLEELGRCLDGLLAGDVAPAEIVVVDQGSELSAEETVRQRDAASTPLVHVQQRARGLSRSRNAGIERTSGGAVAFTDDDCVPSATWVGAIERALADGADAVTGPVLPLGPEQPGLFAVSSRTSMVRHDYRGAVVPWAVGTGANLAVRRDWIERVGLYDERLGVGSRGRAGEDMDFIHRLLRAGATIRYEPDAVVYHARQSAGRRRKTRSGYGRGVGACCGIWLRRRDLTALTVLGHWLVMRANLLARALVRRRWRVAADELLVLRGTLSGIVYGLRARDER